jgi:hypothetical protein
MSPGSGEPLAWAVRLLALPLQAALSVDRLVSRTSRRAEVSPARLTYVATSEQPRTSPP